MKIAIVIERIEAWRGGAEISTFELAHLMAEAGHDVHMVTASRAPSPPDLTIHMLGVGSLLKPLRTYLFVRKAAAFLATQAFDIVHAIAPLPVSDVYQPRGGAYIETLARNVAVRQNRPARLLKRMAAGANLNQRSLLRLERRICRPGGPTIACVSEYVLKQFARHYGLSSPRLSVVFNGVHVRAASPQERMADRARIREQFRVDERTLVVLCVAHNFKLKGVARLIEATARLMQRGIKNVQVWIIGRDNPIPYRQQAVQLGVVERVVFVGSTPRVSAFMHAADMCVHPTYYDPCSRVVLEAMCHGLPVVTTRFNGASEVISEGVQGFTIPTPDDVDALADRIERLSDGALRRDVGAAAQGMRERLSMRGHVEGLLALYERVRSERGCPR